MSGRRLEHGLARRGIPFHGRAEAWIDVGIASGDRQELDGRAEARALGDGERGEEGFSLAIEVGVADDRRQAAYRHGPGPERPLSETIEFRARFVRWKLNLDRPAKFDRDRQKRARGRINEPESGASVGDQSNIDGEVASLVDELLGAVERIDEEEALGKGARVSV